jgi:DNA transformation protein and related proteins
MAKKRPTKTRSRGRVKSLRVSEAFRAYALDQLSSVVGLRARPMFGGFGLYADDVFFGILAADVLYLKVDDSNRHDYERVKSERFHPFENRPRSTSYYAVPLSVLEASPTLAAWAKRSIAVARSGSTTTGRARRRNRVRS